MVCGEEREDKDEEWPKRGPEFFCDAQLIRRIGGCSGTSLKRWFCRKNIGSGFFFIFPRAILLTEGTFIIVQEF